LDAAEIKALLDVKLTVKEFTELFDDLKQGHKPEWLATSVPATNDMFPEAGPIPLSLSEGLVSPKFVTKDSGMFALVPKLSFSSDCGGEEIFDSDLSADTIQALLKEYHRRFSVLKSKWTQTFLEVEASHALVVKDLSFLHNASIGLKEVVGSPDPEQPQTLLLVEGVRELSEEVRSVVGSQQATQDSVELVLKGQRDFRQSIVESLEENEIKLTAAAQSFKVLQDQIDLLTTSNGEFEKRFNIIFPILRDFKRGQNSSNTQPPGAAQHCQT
jgi:hypothetical protein